MDVLSDEILLLVLRHLNLEDLCAISCVNKRCHRLTRDSSLYRSLDCNTLYKLSQSLLNQFVGRGGGFIEHISLRDCYWLNSTVIASALRTCHNLKSLDVIGCNVTIKSLLSVILNNSHLTSLGWTVPNGDIASDLYTNPQKTETVSCVKLREAFIRLHSLSLQFDSVKQFEDIFPLFSCQMQLRELRLQCFRFGERISALGKAKPYYDITMQSSDSALINISAIDQTGVPETFQWNDLLDHRFLHFSLMFFDFIIKTIMDTAKTQQLRVLLAPGSTLCWKYVAYLCETTTLVKADMSNASLGESQITWLLSLHSLTHLNLSKVASASPSLKNVTSVLSNLVVLNLFNSMGCIDEEFNNLTVLATRCPNLKQLNLGNIHCHGSTSIVNLYTSLSMMTNLESLNLAACHKCDEIQNSGGSVSQAAMKTDLLKKMHELCRSGPNRKPPGTSGGRSGHRTLPVLSKRGHWKPGGQSGGSHFGTRLRRDSEEVEDSKDAEVMDTEAEKHSASKRMKIEKEGQTVDASRSWQPCTCPGTSSGGAVCQCNQSSNPGSPPSKSDNPAARPHSSSLRESSRTAQGTRSTVLPGKRHNHCMDKTCRRCYCCVGKFQHEEGYREMTHRCSKMTEFELVAINMETFPHRSPACVKPIKCSLDFSDTCLSLIANWKQLQKLTLGGFHTTGSADYLVAITRECQELQELSLIHLRSLHHSTSVALLNKALRQCTNLRVFRLEQSHFNITESFLSSFHNSKQLHSLCIICSNGKAMTAPPLIELFSQCTYLIALQILCSITKVSAKKVQNTINQRYLKKRPALAVTIEPYLFAASEDGLRSVPSVHLRNLTFYETKVATKFT